MFEHLYNPVLPDLKQTCTVCGKTLNETRGGVRLLPLPIDRCTCLSAKEAQFLEILRQTEFSLTAELATSDSLSDAAVAPAHRATMGGVDLGDKYKVSRMVGSGSMGRIFRIKDAQLGTDLAAKVLHPHVLTDSRAGKRFVRDIAHSTQLIHPNIVDTFESGMTAQGLPYAITEYLVGRNLAKEIEAHGPVEPQRAIKIFIQICNGLEYAHNQGVIHRDLKPSNIFLSSQVNGNDFVKIVDFGIGKITRPTEIGASSLMHTGEIYGSLPYMCPEQCIDEPLSPQSDIYSLGCLMYETLTGRSPYAAENSVKIILRHLSEEGPKPLRQSVRPNTQLPPGLEEVILNCLNRFPQKRYPSAKLLAMDLERVRDGKMPGVLRRLQLPSVRITPLRKKQLVAAAIVCLAITSASLSIWLLKPTLTAPVKPSPVVVDPTVATLNMDEVIDDAHEAAQPAKGASDPKKAIFLYEQALAKVRAHTPADPIAEMNVLHHYGVDLIALGENEMAVKVLQQGLALTAGHGTKQEKLDFYGSLSAAQYNLGQMVEATNNCKTAAELSEQLNPDNFQTLSAVNDMGVLLYHRGPLFFETAKMWFRKAHTIAKHLTWNEKAVKIDGREFQYEGLIADKQGKRGDAAAYFDAALQIFYEYPGKNRVDLKDHYKVLASHYRMAGNNAKAKEYSDLAATIADTAQNQDADTASADELATEQRIRELKSEKEGKAADESETLPTAETASTKNNGSVAKNLGAN